MKTFDLILLYYDKPEILSNWFHRLAFFSDYQKYSDRSKIIIADSGSPRDRLDANLSVLQTLPDWIKSKVIYARADTDELRKQVPSGVSARPQSHAYNMACIDISQADLLIGSVIGHVFTPDYFAGHLIEHTKNEKIICLPQRFDLVSKDYHTKLFTKPWSEIDRLPRLTSGGWPDWSLRRKWYLESGGWDEWYTFISPADMDFGSRMCGKVDNGLPSNFLFPEKGHYDNLGLDFVRPFKPTFFSLTCNSYSGHMAKNDSAREKGHQLGNLHYLANWGVVKRNIGRVPLKYDIVYSG